MRTSKYFALLLLLTLPFACQDDEIGPTQWCDPPMTIEHPLDAELTSLLQDYTRRGLPGIALLVETPAGEWVGSAGYADLDRQIAFQPCHVSKIASITKLFVGTLAMQLVDEEVLALDDPLTKWLDNDVLRKVENASEATFRQVLNHTSGIADLIDQNSFYLDVLNDPARFWQPEDLLRYVYRVDADFPLGTDVMYSNTNLLLAAMVIEAATGESHAKLLRERIFDPLALSDTYYHWHEALPEHTAQGYFDLYNNGTILTLSNLNTGSGNGYGGIYSTVFDVRDFLNALLREQTLLSPEALSQMLTFTEEEEGKHRALGLGIMKDFLERAPDEYGLGHRGRDLAYSADGYYFPNQEVTMVYLVNYGTDAESSLQPVFFEFRDALVDILMRE
jgi:D-alanyl-D-alanine carboxypeptidase